MMVIVILTWKRNHSNHYRAPTSSRENPVHKTNSQPQQAAELQRESTQSPHIKLWIANYLQDRQTIFEFRGTK